MSEIHDILNRFDKHRGKIDLSLGRITEFLGRIGNPHLKIPPVIHFAGTNGKGSTIAFLKAIIEANSQLCHSYTSPHLVRFNERINISGKEIDDKFLLEILREVEREYEKHKHEIGLTFFELTTVTAFIAFSRVKADYILLETGLGGQFDATNLLAKPLLTVITPISFDHMEFLGDTLAKIAYEKAGIMKPNVPCISAPQAKEVIEVLSEVARKNHIELMFAATHQELPKLALAGDHQKVNASVAIATARKIGLSEKAIAEGLTTAIWPARMQKLTRGKLPEMLPTGFELWLDGAHNLDGARVLAAEIGKLKKPVYLILGMMKTKDAQSYFQQFEKTINCIYTIPIPSETNCYDPEILAEMAKKLWFKAEACDDAEEALDKIIAQKEPATIFICGSLYLAGKILENNS